MLERTRTLDAHLVDAPDWVDRSQPPISSALRHVDQSDVSQRARAEARRREAFLPPTGIYRWWARRTGAVSRSLIDAAYAESAATRPLMIADTFAGGGVIALAARQRGHKVYAQDLNPWAALGLKTMLDLPRPEDLAAGAQHLMRRVRELGIQAYGTQFAEGDACQIAHTLRVATLGCTGCGHQQRLFPHALVSLAYRRDSKGTGAFLSCPKGHLHYAETLRKTRCPTCTAAIDPSASYQPGRMVTCAACGKRESLAERSFSSGWSWDLALVERSDGKRREFGLPTADERRQAEGAQWNSRRKLGAIPDTPETSVLRRHGLTDWTQIYPERQRHVTERLLEEVFDMDVDERVRNVLAICVYGTCEMAGLLSRWDRYYLKSYEAMASHRFNLTTLSAEPNVIGGDVHGRGSLAQRLALAGRAAMWSAQHIETGSPVVALRSCDAFTQPVGAGDTTIVTGSSERLLLADQSVDLIVTDPPYHDDVQYHELSLPLRAWAALGLERPAGEAIAIPHSKALADHRVYREVLTRVFEEMKRVLTPTGRLILTYANRDPAAWTNLFAALNDAGLVPLGYTILHAENEIDHAKRARRACTLDLVLELSGNDGAERLLWRPTPIFDTAEENYLIAVGDAFLDSSHLDPGWEQDVLRRIARQPFLDPIRCAKPRSSPRSGDCA